MEEQTHEMVKITVYFNRNLTEDEIMNFVDNAFVEYDFVDECEYE